MPVTLISWNAACSRAERLPGVAALRDTLEEGDIRRLARTTFAARESRRDDEDGGE
jgi:hypothetical protein